MSEDQYVDWQHENTPTIEPQVVRSYLERIRRTSQIQQLAAGLCCLEIMNLDGIVFQQSQKDAILGAAQNIIKKYFQRIVDEHSEFAYKQSEKLSEDLDFSLRVNDKFKEELADMREAFSKFMDDGNLEHLSRVMFSVNKSG